ncbi:threonylcarbamoyl-AMP synthase [candidate division WWE3 bacterium]|uniref:L-threonylcarbamoyladenylate synthase n=1 Tax=candidate division WWE3 bacterium TaxID=2053526 RepID=A0A955LGX8_UNCKA|nr:threonylcarbamoyl-AMP synthase [candidate division WWE3 bacterium]
MDIITDFNDPKLQQLLMNYGVGVLPTDTQYGLVGKALSVTVVEKIYALKGRSADKPLIILISELSDLDTFFVTLTKNEREFLEENWPAQLSAILSCNQPDLTYLHRGTNSLAFRLPDHPDLVQLIKTVGPLVAPSANLEREEPASTIKQAQDYFKDQVDFYVDGGALISPPSTLIQFVDHSIEIIREGAYSLR